MAQFTTLGMLRPGYWQTRPLSSPPVKQSVAAFWSLLFNGAAASREAQEIVGQWHDTDAATVRASAREKLFIEQLYTLVVRNHVTAFLDQHPFLVPILLEAYTRILIEFPQSRLFLRIVSDPDIETMNGADQLVLSIATLLEPEDAMDRLDRLDNTWWLHTLPQAQGKLCINLEYL